MNESFSRNCVVTLGLYFAVVGISALPHDVIELYYTLRGEAFLQGILPVHSIVASIIESIIRVICGASLVLFSSRIAHALPGSATSDAVFSYRPVFMLAGLVVLVMQLPSLLGTVLRHRDPQMRETGPLYRDRVFLQQAASGVCAIAFIAFSCRSKRKILNDQAPIPSPPASR